MASGLDGTVRQAMLNQLSSLVTHFSLHTADGSTTGANEMSTTANSFGNSYARLPVTWGSASGTGYSTCTIALTGTPYTFNVANSATVAFVGMFSAITAGTWRGEYDVLDEVFSAAGGQYQVLSASVTLT